MAVLDSTPRTYALGGERCRRSRSGRPRYTPPTVSGRRVQSTSRSARATWVSAREAPRASGEDRDIVTPTRPCAWCIHGDPNHEARATHRAATGGCLAPPTRPPRIPADRPPMTAEGAGGSRSVGLCEAMDSSVTAGRHARRGASRVIVSCTHARNESGPASFRAMGLPSRREGSQLEPDGDISLWIRFRFHVEASACAQTLVLLPRQFHRWASKGQRIRYPDDIIGFPSMAGSGGFGLDLVLGFRQGFIPGLLHSSTSRGTRVAEHHQCGSRCP